MKKAPQKTIDSTTEEVREKRSRQSMQKAVPRQAPLKEQGQPARRDVKED